MLIPVVVYHIVVCLASDCESWFVMLSQWFRIMVYYAEPVVVNHVCYLGQVYVNHGE
jgi:hypothetical protein